MIKCIFLIVLFLVLPSPCLAAWVFIDGSLGANCTNGTYSPTYRDCNGGHGDSSYNAYKDCSLLDGYPTSVYSAGDTVWFRGGIYNCAGNSDALIVGGNNTTWSGWQDEVAIIDGSPKNRDGIFTSGYSGITIQKLTVRNANSTNGLQGGKGVLVYGNADNTTVSQVISYNNDRAGIAIIGESGTYPSVDPDNCVIEYCVAYGNGFGGDGEAGLQIWGAGANTIVRYNRSYNNGQPMHDLGSNWTEEGAGSNLFWISYPYHSLPGGTTIKLYVKNVGTDCCPYGKKESSKGAVDTSSGHCANPMNNGVLGDYWIDTANSRIYIYYDRPDNYPGQTYVCRSPTGSKYPDGNGLTVDVNSGGTYIYGNIFYGNGGSGINVSNPHESRIYIYNNTCYNNGQQACSWADPKWWGDIKSYANRANINIAYSEDYTVKNNIMSGGFNYNLTTSSEAIAGSHTIDHNQYYNAGDYAVRWVDTEYTLSGFRAATPHEDHGIESNPLFVNPSSSNFHLQSDSPAIDAGTTISGIPAQDMDGTARPQGSAWDIGAYEYGSGDLDPPSPPKGLRIQ